MSDFNDKQIQIMEAAERLFAAKGFDGTSVRDIAESAGVNLAMISYYFGSKEKLMEAMFTHRSAGFKLQLESTVSNKNLNPIQRMEHLIDQYIDKLTSQQSFHLILVREQMVNKNSHIAQQIQQLKQRNQGLIKELILEGQKSGHFKKNVDIPLMMMTLIGTVSQLVTTQHYYREINNLQNMSDEDYLKHIRKKLSQHLKTIFKAILNNEE